MFMIQLEGQGDTHIMFVDQEIWDWVFSPYVEGVDPNVPQRILDEGSVHIGRKSYENDRALHIGDAAQEFFFDMTEALEYIRENDIEIKDTYGGYIY